MALTKVTGQVIKSDTNITSHNINSSGIITAVSFSGPFSGTGGNFTGIITATAATFSGNVTIGGTLTYEDVTNIDSVGVVTARAGIDLTGGNITLGDSGGSSDDRIKLGADGDLSIYHNGSAGYISNTSSALYLQAKTGQNGINIWPDGVLQLHHSGSEKLETQSWGFWSHGSIKPSADTYDLGGNHVSNRWNDIFVADTGEINIGDGSDLTIQHNATNSVIKNITGDLEFQEHTSSGNIIFKTTTSGTERLSIKSDGKIGIGSAVPAYNLDISGSGTQQLAIQSTNANDAVLRLNNSVLNWDLDNDGNGGIAAAGSLHLRNSSLGDAAVMSFTSAGNVGIGTIAPGALLHLSTATPVIRLTDTDTSGPIHTNIDGASGYLTLDVGSVHRDVIITSVDQANEIARFEGDGNVLIGGNLKTNNLPGRNILYNGAMQIAQRDTNATNLSNTNNYPTADRWRLVSSNAGTYTADIMNDAPANTGFRKSFKLSCTTANNAGESNLANADGYLAIEQRLEGYDVQCLKKGGSNAESLSISFWCKSDQTGTYNVELYDVDNARRVGSQFTVDSSATWEKKTFTFAGDTSGGTLSNDNTDTFRFRIYLAAGNNFRTGTNSGVWAANVANQKAQNNQNLSRTQGNYWMMTGVKLEIGSIVTEYDHKPYGEELRLCQRYFVTWPPRSGGTPAWPIYTGSNQASAYIWIPYTMRTTPTPTDKGTGTNTTTGYAYNNNGQGVSSRYANNTSPTLSCGGENGQYSLKMDFGSHSSGDHEADVASWNGTGPGIFLDSEL